MKKSTMSLLFFVLLPFNALAENTFFVCEEDSRPVDGDYRKISIVQDESGKHDIYQSFISGGLFPKGHKKQSIKNDLIAENLFCSMKIGGIECYNENEPSRLPILKFQKVWMSKEAFIEVTYNLKKIALFLDSSCN